MKGMRLDIITAYIIFTGIYLVGCNPKSEPSETVISSKVERANISSSSKITRVNSSAAVSFVDFTSLSKDQLTSLIQGTQVDCSDEAQAGFIRQCFKTLAEISLEEANDLATKYSENSCEEPALSGIALAFIEEGSTAQPRAKLHEQIKSLVESDPDRAIAMIESITDDGKREKAQIALLEEWGKTAPMDAIGYALKQPRSFEFGSAIWKLGEEAARQDPQVALERGIEHAVSGSNDLYLSALYGEWSKTDPVVAADALKFIDHDTRINNRIYRLVGENYAQNPEKAKVWLQTIENPMEQKNAVSSFTKQWAVPSPEATANWANSLESGFIYDNVARTLASSFSENEPDYALEWAISIEDKDIRKRAVSRTYNSWKLDDPASAKNWLDSTDLISERDKGALE